MIDTFEYFGRSLAARFRACRFDHQQFPQLAARALEQFVLPELNSAALYAAVLNPALAAQRLDDQFSDFPLVLYQHAHFRVELLGWLQSTTSIHQHAFSGAFRVWRGSSVHSWYQFTEQQRYSTMLRRGQIKWLGSELLQAGDVRKIAAGPGLTHAVFHLDAPTFSLVVRTHSEPWNGPQFNLLFPAFAYQPDSLRSELLPLQKLVMLQQQLDEAAAVKQLVAHMEQVTLAAVVVYGGWWMMMAQRAGLSDVFHQAVALVHGESLAELLPGLAQRYSMDRQGQHLRTRVSLPEARLLVGLLMNVPHRETLQRLLQQSWPDADDRRILIRAMCQLLESGELSVTLRGEPVAGVVAALLQADDAAGFIRLIEAQSPDVLTGLSTEALDELYRRLRTIPIFSALFN